MDKYKSKHVNKRANILKYSTRIHANTQIHKYKFKDWHKKNILLLL